MASSTYKVYAVASVHSGNVLEYSGKKVYYVENHAKSIMTLVDASRDEAYQKAGEIILNDGSHHTCRETMISSMMHMQEKLSVLCGHFTYPYRYGVVEYFHEEGRNLTEDDMTSIVNFMAVINQSLPSPISVGIKEDFTEGGRKALLFHFPYEMQNLYVLSFLLYIFRNREIMNTLYPLLSRQLSFKGNMNTISKKFTENPAWGNEANPAGNLAFFAYSIYRGYRFVTENDGPVSASVRVHDISTLKDFMEDIVGMDNLRDVGFTESMWKNIIYMERLLIRKEG